MYSLKDFIQNTNNAEKEVSMAHTYDELRKTYTEFIYESYTSELIDDGLKLTYHFVVPGLAEFRPTLTLPINHELVINDPHSELAERIIFSIGLVELVSYWKIACPPNVVVKAGQLNEEQVDWWKRLYFNGLGEFFFENDIDARFNDFMNMTSAGPEVGSFSNEFELSGKNLIPIGGGKDSIVTVEHLAPLHEDNVTFGVNPTIASLDTMEIAGYNEEQRFIVSRTLDQEMLRLNSENYLNGHTPFSALLAFVSYLSAYLIGAEYIVLSNEASANAASIPGTEINHQYSKTSEFEVAFQAYTKEYFSDKIFYFSILRPFAEIAIAKSFSQYEQYFYKFRSCNRGSKKNVWCGECAKCLFIFAMLAPFVDEGILIEIFDKNIWEDESLLELWEMLSGIVAQKPFECVGTIEEVQYAIYLVSNQYFAKGEPLPYLLNESFKAAQAGEYSELKFVDGRLVSTARWNPLHKWHVDERVPEKFRSLVQDIIE